MSHPAPEPTAVVTAPAKNKAGRPRAFVDLARVTELAGQGLSMTDIARRLGVSERLMWSRLAEDPDVRRAYDQGAMEVLDLTTKTLLEMVKEKNLGAVVFMLRNRFKWTAGASHVDVTVRHAPVPTIDGHVMDMAREHSALLDSPWIEDAEFSEVTEESR